MKKENEVAARQHHTHSNAISVLERRVWLLLLLDGAERAGITPLASVRLHRIAFLANCLSPVYDLAVADGKIMKYTRGPFYPVLQWDIDRMVAQGLVEAPSFGFDIADEGWFAADYQLASSGVSAAAAVGTISRFHDVRAYLREVASAFASMAEDSREPAAIVDATYGDPFQPNGSLIDFAEWQDRNFSQRTAVAFDALVQPGVRLGARDRLHLYFRYLSRMVERAAG